MKGGSLMKKPNQQPQQKGTKQTNVNESQNYLQEASEELMQEKGIQKAQKQQKKT